ncbi:hypothetical protein M422DRAFT_249218 [Sphaerobolus stellatus SS14]|nr:hypothetical protein M422DRAFT_249218 [Sphaerobolus stellatus SS14]
MANYDIPMDLDDSGASTPIAKKTRNFKTLKATLEAFEKELGEKEGTEFNEDEGDLGENLFAREEAAA